MSEKLLEVKHLKKYFKTKKGPLRAVDDVSFSIGKGETLGLVGESGCGKSTCGRAIIRLNDPNAGEVIFEGKNILDFHRRADLRRMKQEMQIVFQDPYSSLNPRLNTQDLIADPLVINKIGRNKEEIRQKVLEAMEMVGLEKRLLDAYPHELDGGRRQRIGIARRIRYRQHEIPLCIRHRSDIFPFDADTDVGHGRTIRRIEYATAQQVLRTCGGKATRQHGNTNANSHTVSGLHRERYGMRIYCESERIFTSVAFRGRIR